MIAEFSIENFGCIKEKQTLSFEPEKGQANDKYYVVRCGKYKLLKLAIIYGANASGKTTVLQALDFLRKRVCINPADKSHEYEDLNPFLLSKPVNPNTKFDISFIQDGVKFRYLLEINRKYVVSEKLEYFNNESKIRKPTIICERTTDAEKQVARISVGASIPQKGSLEKALNDRVLWNTTIFNSYMSANIDFPLMQQATKWFFKNLRAPIHTRTSLKDYTTEQIVQNKIQKERIVELLQEADFNINGIDIDEVPANIPPALATALKEKMSNDDFLRLSKNNEVSFTHLVGDNLMQLPYADESDGTQKYYDLSSILCQLVDLECVFAIDELEASLHPDLYRHFLLSFIKNSTASQLILATHNRDILEDKDIMRYDIIWFTAKNKDGATELYSLADFGTNVIRKGSNVLIAYKIGKFGARPNISEHFIPKANEAAK